MGGRVQNDLELVAPIPRGPAQKRFMTPHRPVQNRTFVLRTNEPPGENLLFSLHAVPYALRSFFAGAVRAAVESSVHLYAVANDAAATVMTGRGQFTDRALKTIEYMFLTGQNNLKGLVVLIATLFTLGHPRTSFSQITIFTSSRCSH